MARAGLLQTGLTVALGQHGGINGTGVAGAVPGRASGVTGVPAPRPMPDGAVRVPGAPVESRPVGGVPFGPVDREPPTIPANCLPHRSPRELLTLAGNGLREAAETRSDGPRYAAAHLAALRAAAAVLVARARPVAGRRGRPTSVWVLLAEIAPEMAEWASLFAAGAAKRSAAEAGISRVVTPWEADRLLANAERFVGQVRAALGLPHQAPLVDRAG